MQFRFPLPRWLLLGVGLLAVTGRAAEGLSRQQMEDLFQRDRVFQVALAPDGAHFAYAVREGRTVGLVVVPVAAPERKKLVRLGEDETADVFRRRVTFPVQLTLLRWASERQLLYGLSSREGGQRRRDELRSIDADGTNDRLLLNAIDLDYIVDEVIMPRYPEAIRWSAANADTLLFEAVDPRRKSLAARLAILPAPTALFTLNVATGKHQWLGTQEDADRTLYDQQGRPRLRETERLKIFLEGPPMASGGGTGESIRIPPPAPMVVPQRFQIKGADGSGKWEDLDEWLGREAGLTFAHKDSDTWGPRAIPLAFDADPNIFYYASNMGRDTYGIYALDLRTKRRTAFALEDARVDLVDFTSVAPESALIFDRQQRLAGVRVPGAPSRTRWLDPELARLQATLNGKFPGRSVEIMDWGTTTRHIAALVTGPGDPGRYFVHDNGTDRLTEMVRRAARLPAEMLGRAGTFEFTAPDGAKLTATVTVPRRPWVKLPPLVVLCPDVPAWRDDGGFARDAQALAAAGFLVLQVDYRGVSGYGAAHREAIRAGIDRVPIGDLRAAIDALAGRHAFDRRRVALVGEGFGGYVGLRALQLHPGEFRCAVTFNAPTDLAWWVTGERGKMEGMETATNANVDRPEIVARRLLFGTDKEKLAAVSVLPNGGEIKQPVLIIQEARSNLWPTHGTQLRDRLKRAGTPVEFAELEPREDRSTPEGRAQTYRRATEFLIEHLYNFGVRLGQEKEVP